MLKAKRSFKQRAVSIGMSTVLTLSMVGGYAPTLVLAHADTTAEKAEEVPGVISNDSLKVQIGDLGQISMMNINNNRKNSFGKDVNFVLPNDTKPQNDVQHQWMGEMIFSYRTSEDGKFPEDNTGFVEVDTNKTLAAGGSTTYSNATENLESNPYIKKNVVDDKKVEVNFIGQDEDATTERTMKGFDVKSVYDMDTEDGSLLWEITLSNKGSKYIEFGDVGLPMPWNNKYTSTDSVYNERVTAHTFAGADSGYAYAIRCSGEGNYVLFTPVPESGARIEYVDNWVGNNNGVKGERNSSLFSNWTSDGGGWQPGLSVYYIHSKDIQKTGRGYYTDATSLVLKPGESKTYQFKFSAIRAGDNTPQESVDSPNNASDSVEEREKNMRSVLYNSGMIDAVAVPSFQTAINMPVKLDLHYDDSKVKDVKVDIQCVHENDPFDDAHIPEQTEGLVNNSRADRGTHDGNPNYQESCKFVETKIVDGEQHHIYELNFGCIGNNSVRVDYKLDVDGTLTDKFTQYEFNVLTELDEAIETHADFMVENQQDTNPESPTYGIYSDWFFESGKDKSEKTHWGDDWSHDNINFITMKNYLKPDAEQVKSIENYLIDFMWENYMKYTQENYTVANYLKDSGIYASSVAPYNRTFSEMMECTGFFNMYRIQKAYPDLIEYREDPRYYLEKAYNIYYNRVGAGNVGFYGEQQVPDMIEALYAEGMTEEAQKLQKKFAYTKGTAMATARYPYGSEFAYDNTGEEGAYAAAKALRKYYPDNKNVNSAEQKMSMAEWKTRAMRGVQPTWYQYADPVFIGGESWWNFQYTASLAGSIMNDWLLYQNNGWDNDTSAWAQRVNYGAKISNFNAINMGQISSDYIGNVSWRYTMYKGGHGAMNVNDGGNRVMNNGWNDFSGESDEGLYGSLLSISSDVVTDPVFGLVGYGSEVSKEGTRYTIIPKDGIGKRINVIDSKVYLTLEQDSCTKAVVDEKGTYFDLTLESPVNAEHLSEITLSGAGVADGYYSIKLDGNEVGQCYVKDNAGTANVVIPAGETANVIIEKMDKGENQAPVVSVKVSDDKLQALVPFTVTSDAYDDGAPEGKLTYKWEAVKTPENGTVTFENDNMPYTQAAASVEGEYVIQVTVSDGELETKAELPITLDVAPDRVAPTIGEVTAVQDPVNTSVAALEGEATGDPLYHGELSYQWSVVSKPEGSTAVIGNADQANALLKASMPGEYVVRFTAIDADTSSYKDVTVNMTGVVDGVDRAVNVVTTEGTAPVLPETMEVIYPDGTVEDSEVVWDEIAPENYAKKGAFTATGTVKGTDMKAAATVYVVAGENKNLAPLASASAIINSVQDLGGVAGLNDGADPSSSSDTSNGAWHNWLGDQGGPAWVEYTWDGSIVATGMDVYVFKDGGGNFQPKDMQIMVRDTNGNWYTPRNVEGLGNELNKYNTTTFEPSMITGIRIDMKPVKLGCGILEWKVYGYPVSIVDKTSLRKLYNSVNSLKVSQLIGGLDPIAEELAAAKAAISADATQEEVDKAYADLSAATKNLVPKNGNLAFVAELTASYTSSWESLPAIKDEKQLSGSHWGTWGNESGSEWVQYSWPAGRTVQSSDLYIWNDGGGIRTPKSYTYSYLPMDSDEWVTLKTVKEEEIKENALNHVEFDVAVEARALRCTLEKPERNGEGVGVWEWEVYGVQSSDVDKTDLRAAITEAQALKENDYTEETWAELEKALAAAEAVVADGNADQEAVNKALDDLNKAVEALEEAEPTGDINLAPEATPSGSADYVNDLGGVASLNNGFEPANSGDMEHGAWHNWNDRDKDAWVMYTWEKPVEISSTDVYFFQNGAGSFLPESVKFEYQDLEDETWKDLPNAKGLETELDKYNTTTFDTVKTKAIRMLMTPQDLPGDPFGNKGCGVLEWKVYGKYAEETPDVANKDALERVIAEADSKFEGDYTSNSWAVLEEEKANAENVYADETADQATVDAATEALQKAIHDLKLVKPFPDVAESDWFYNEIQYVYENDIMTGLDDGTFAPYTILSRAQFVLTLYRLEGSPEVDSEPEYEDVAAGEWYADAVVWASKAGIVTGYTDTGAFGPADEITREQMATMMHRYADYKGYDVNTEADYSKYEDAEKVTGFAEKAMAWAVGNGIIKGKFEETQLDPQGETSRAEAAIILARFMEMM